MSSSGSASFLERLALHRPELRAWALYDWANSAVVTTVVATVFPLFFSHVACAGLPAETATDRWALVTTCTLLVIALLAPVLGALADAAAAKKKLLGVFLALGAVSTASLFTVERGEWLAGALLFGLANIGLSGSFVFYDALLPAIARGRELDRLSSSGYALGYLGGGLLLAINLAWIEYPAFFGLPSGEQLSPAEASLPARLSFLSAAVWWLGFSLPLFFRVPEPDRISPSPAGRHLLRSAFAELATTLREISRYRQALLFLAAFFAYNDGIGTVIRMAVIFGDERGIPRATLISAILMVQFVGIPCSLFFGWMASRLGAKRAILIAIAVYVVIVFQAINLESARDFYVLAGLVGLVQGGAQALSRSLYARMVPAHKTAEFFGLFSALEKCSGVLGPAVFFAARRIFGAPGAGVLSLIAFFALGAVLLAKVDVQAGIQAARSAEGDARGG